MPGITLWRYLDLAKFVALLETKAIHFCRGDQFEDQLEGSYPVNTKSAPNFSYRHRKDFLKMYFYSHMPKRLRHITNKLRCHGAATAKSCSAAGISV